MSDNQCSEITYHLDCLIKIFKDLNQDNQDNVDNTFFTKQEILQNLFFFTNKKERIERILELNAQSDNQNTPAVDSCCEHEFVNDYIDLTPEKSERIVYCKFCFLTL